MKAIRRPRILAVILLAYAGLLSLKGSFAQTVDELEWKSGYHGFNQICSGLELQHLDYKSWSRADPKSTVLVVFGDFSPGIARYLREGGAVLFATEQNSNRLVNQGLFVVNLGVRAMNPQDYAWSPDCPVVQVENAKHPAILDVSNVICNQPRVIFAGVRNRGGDWLLEFPVLLQGGLGNSNYLAYAKEFSGGGRLFCLGDQSIFTNQMLIHGDNAKLAKQVVSWLKASGRDKVLVWDAQGPSFPQDLSSLDVYSPPPTREEVLEALKNLPPSMLLEFGNEVASSLEDQNLVNEFFREFSNRIRPKAMNRFLIFLAFASAFVFAFMVFAGQRRLAQQSASGIASQKVAASQKKNKQQERIERLMAADALLDSFCLDVANRRFRNWGDFPDGLSIAANENGNLLRAAMLKTKQTFETRPPKYWSRVRLLELEQEVNHWRMVFGLEPTTSRQFEDS